MRIETQEITLEPARYVFVNGLATRRSVRRTQGIFLLLIGVYVSVAVGFGGSKQLGMVLVIAALLAGFTAYLPVRMRAQAQRVAMDPANARFFRPYRLVVDGDKLQVMRTGDEEGSNLWSNLIGKHVMSDGVVLYLSRQQFLWLPWSSLRAADRAAMEAKITDLPVLDSVPNRPARTSNG